MMTTNSLVLSQSHGNGRWLLRLAVALIAAFACLALSPGEAHAENLIKRPGAHNHYKFELEPHLAVWYGWGNGNDAEVGPGIRASIPFMHNGPIDTINNNIGISFGVQTFFPNDAFLMSMPVAFQWNFYFTDVISVIGEAGLVTNFATNGGGPGDDNFDLDPLFQGGGRFQWGKIGVVVRVGYPTVSVGCNIQF
jgi:hypothetical protein